VKPGDTGLATDKAWSALQGCMAKPVTASTEAQAQSATLQVQTRFVALVAVHCTYAM
jgi:hypothetical protein